MLHRQLIVGAGEVGQALATILHRYFPVEIRDIGQTDHECDVLHVAIPWQDEFVTQVKEYADLHRAQLVVVHSTVPVGTCDEHGWVHSPVRGRHPHLDLGIAAFIKHVGGLRAVEAAEVFEFAGIRTVIHPRAADTEAGKLWELVQYGLQISIERAIHVWCTANDLDFDTVYTQFANTYNHGYALTGDPQFIRPVIEHMPGPIGGHCIIQNAELLDHPLAQFLLTIEKL